MKLNELIEQLGLSNDALVKTFDITTKEGYDGFKSTINELKDSDTDLFDALGIDMDEWLDSVEKLGDKIYKDSQEKSKKEKSVVKTAIKQMERKEVDHSDEDDDYEYEVDNYDEEEYKGEDTKNVKVKEQEFKRPSELLSINQKLQLHKLVQEYVDTTIRPFNKGVLTNDQINDAYAGLYEFGAWIINR